MRRNVDRGEPLETASSVFSGLTVAVTVAVDMGVSGVSTGTQTQPPQHTDVSNTAVQRTSTTVYSTSTEYSNCKIKINSW